MNNHRTPTTILRRFSRFGAGIAALSLASLLGGCANSQSPERVELLTIHSEAEKRDMQYAVYTPPGWDGETELPLVVFLHGGGDDEMVLHEHERITETLDEWILAGKLEPMLMVAPDGERGMWANWYDGTHAYEDWVVEDVLPDVRARYPVKEGRENTHLMGISMGGAGTMYMVMHHPELFGSATFLSAPIFDSKSMERFLKRPRRLGMPVERMFGPPDAERIAKADPYQALPAPGTEPPKIFMGAGRRDIPGLLGLNRKFQKSLEERGIDHHYVEYRGGHDWRSWSQLFPVALCLHTGGDECIDEEERFYSISSFENPEESVLGSPEDDVAPPVSLALESVSGPAKN